PGRGARVCVRRVLWRLHDQLDRGPDRPLPLPGQPRRQPRRAHGLPDDGGAVVPGVGARRAPVGEARGPRAAPPHRPYPEVEDADARGPRREGLSRGLRPGPRDLHRPAAPRHPLEAARLSRREPLGAEAAELQAVARDRDRLAGPVAEDGRRGPPSGGPRVPRRRRRIASLAALAQNGTKPTPANRLPHAPGALIFSFTIPARRLLRGSSDSAE